MGLDPQRTAPIISVRQARGLISKLALRPYRARHRFVIIDPADAMRAETANALLKTFEEPPRDTGFMLICESARRLLPTVRSRSQRVRFRPLANAELADWLRQRGIEEASWLAQMADGCPGRALALSDGEAATWRTIRDDLLQALQASAGDRFSYAESMTKAKKGRAEWTPRVEAAIDALERLNRDALCKHAGLSDDALYNVDQLMVVEQWSQRLQLPGFLRISQAIDQARRDMEAYVNGRLLLDALLARVVAELGPLTR
jgi:DNA polymerase-3 subunit delta'